MQNHVRRLSSVAALAIALLLPAACVSPNGDSVGAQQASAMQMHDDVLSQAKLTYPELEEQIDGAAGYAVFDTAVLKILIIGTANGYGVVVDRGAASHSIVNNFGIAIGPGIELTRTHGVVVLHTYEALADARAGDWNFGGAAMIGLEIGDVGGDASTASLGGGTSMYRDMQYGLGIHASVFWMKSSLDDELN